MNNILLKLNHQILITHIFYLFIVDCFSSGKKQSSKNLLSKPWIKTIRWTLLLCNRLKFTRSLLVFPRCLVWLFKSLDRYGKLFFQRGHPRSRDRLCRSFVCSLVSNLSIFHSVSKFQFQNILEPSRTLEVACICTLSAFYCMAKQHSKGVSTQATDEAILA